MNIRIAPLLLLSLLLTVGGSAVAQTPFTDNFENPTINLFWTIVDQAGSGSVNLDTAFVHSGNQSVQVNTDIVGGQEALSHSFPSPLYGSVSVWVYYSNTTGTGYKQLDILEGLAFSGIDYLVYIDWGDLQTYVRDSSGVTSLIAPAQSTGWHKWTFASASEGVTIRIDDRTVFTQPVGFAFQTVNLQQCCLAGSAFFDDFRFTPAGLPTGEKTSWDRWFDETVPTWGLWNAILSPTNGNFNNLIVRETNGNPGGGGSGKDTCWYQGSKYPHPFDKITGGQWTVSQGIPDTVGDNEYGQDRVGYNPTAVQYYRKQGRVPCGTEFKQIMEIQDPITGDWVPYGGNSTGNPNTLGAKIGVNSVSSIRAGQIKTKRY